MAAIFQPQPPQQQQAQTAFASQTAPSPNTQDPLFQALVKHITTGPGAQNVTAGEVQTLIAAADTQPGGRAYLESLTSAAPEPAVGALWGGTAYGGGQMVITKTSATLNMQFISLNRSFEGKVAYPFVPSSNTVTGTLYYEQDLLNAGALDIEMLFSYGRFTITLHWQGKLVGTIVLSQVVFPFPQNQGVRGTGTFN